MKTAHLQKTFFKLEFCRQRTVQRFNKIWISSVNLTSNFRNWNNRGFIVELCVYIQFQFQWLTLIFDLTLQVGIFFNNYNFIVLPE